MALTIPRRTRSRAAVVDLADADARRRLDAGFRAIAQLVLPTLGPFPRMVAVAPIGSGSPELLDDGGLIARRVVQLDDRIADVGAMFLRSLLWQAREELGDGVATTCAMFMAAWAEMQTAIAAGCDPVALRESILAALPRIDDALMAQAHPIATQDGLRAVARTLLDDATLAEVVTEAIWVHGAEARYEVRTAWDGHTACTSLDGAWWTTSVHDNGFLSDTVRHRADLALPAVLVSDLDLDDPSALAPLVAAIRASGATSAVLIARAMSAEVTRQLLAIAHSGLPIVAVRPPGGSPFEQDEILEDIRVLVGGRRFRAVAGESLARIQPDDLGRVRRVWVERGVLGIAGPTADPLARRARIGELRRQLADADDAARRRHLRHRLAALLGNSALIGVAGATSWEVDRRKAQVTRAIDALRLTLADGTVPGGGLALLTARQEIVSCESVLDVEARAAERIIARALAAPTRQLARNAGIDPARIFATLETDPEASIDLRGDGAPVRDALATIRGAVRIALTGAAQATSIDTIVLHRHPTEAGSPHR